MTSRTPRACYKATCLTAAEPGTRACAAHRRPTAPRREAARPGATKRGGGKRWMKFRWSFLSRHVRCFDCLEAAARDPRPNAWASVQMSQEIHHVQPLALGGAVYDTNNCVGLCVRHHLIRTNAQRPKKERSAYV